MIQTISSNLSHACLLFLLLFSGYWEPCGGFMKRSKLSITSTNNNNNNNNHDDDDDDDDDDND